MSNSRKRRRASSKATIGHLLPWPSIGGVEVATLRIIKATSADFRHVAFCIRGSSELAAACEQAGAEVAFYHPPEPSLRHGWRYMRESMLVAKELRQRAVDLAHCSEIKAVYHNSLASTLARVPLISHVRCRYPELSLRDRLTYRPVKHFVFVSHDSRRQFALKLKDVDTSVLYDGFDFPSHSVDVAAVRADLGVPAGPLIGMVARVNPQKDYDTLVDAAAVVAASRPDAHFIVVGDHSIVELNRSHYDHVCRRLEQAGIRERFTFTGFRSDVSRILAALDIFVLCTHREGLPLSILEAMAHGKPVIATSVDGIPELITHGSTGLLHEHKNSAELAALILSCLNDPEMAQTIGQAGRAHCRQHFSAAAFAANAAALYRGFLANVS